MILTLREPSQILERGLAGRIWKVERDGKVVYIVKGRVPEGLLSQIEIISSKEIQSEFKLVSREYSKDNTCVKIKDVEFGGEEVVVCAGPCAVEGLEMMREVARDVKNAGARALRGGAFKPRTSPYSFQGLGEEGLKILREVSGEVGLPVVTEVLSPEQVNLVSKYADALQIGARNMQNFELLRAVGRSMKPVLLKRGPSAKIEEWLLAAEYILLEGNWNVILCERGIRTFEDATRNVLDVSGIALTKLLTHLPVVADPSHATGRSELVPAASKAAIAAGADGLLIEVHPRPEAALSDGPQSLTLKAFHRLMDELAVLTRAVGRRI
ncbi:MAG: 3-deoxy-7-phosphoheptulonate synthase [Candidatus Methanomethyliales bacterium]|nr:3-deoxy-7-phosphoheptulonate synthase [Candidatus Methanomethylicales archaeon]